MRRTLFLLAALVPVIALAQTDGKPLLNELQAKLNSAKSLSTNYSIQIIGGTSSEYNVTLSKPNLAKLDGPANLVVADGTNITFFNKLDKTFYKQPQTAEALEQVFNQENARLWLPFFKPDAFASVRRVKNEGLTTRRGMQVTKLSAYLDDTGKRTMVIYVDPTGLPRQQEISQQDIKGNSTLLLFAKSLDLSDQPIEANKLAFVAPEGSRELSLDEVNASKWYENLEEAKAAAARTHKLVMVDFYADW